MMGGTRMATHTSAVMSDGWARMDHPYKHHLTRPLPLTDEVRVGGPAWKCGFQGRLGGPTHTRTPLPHPTLIPLTHTLPPGPLPHPPTHNSPPGPLPHPPPVKDGVGPGVERELVDSLSKALVLPPPADAQTGATGAGGAGGGAQGKGQGPGAAAVEEVPLFRRTDGGTASQQVRSGLSIFLITYLTPI